jgi:predicted pyridoxine 5'-phosphate oxidase superfamily flavin-nucleotide-binding protein
MIELNEGMAEAINKAAADAAPVLVATSSADGMPDIAYKGSVMVFDNDHLAWWERALGTTLANVRENGQACLYYVNRQTRRSWKFFGTAEVIDEGPVREEVMSRTIQGELDRDPERKGVAVMVRVDKVIEPGKEPMVRE